MALKFFAGLFFFATQAGIRQPVSYPTKIDEGSLKALINLCFWLQMDPKMEENSSAKSSRALLFIFKIAPLNN